MEIPPQLSRAPFVAYTGALCGGILLFYRVGLPAWSAIPAAASGILLWLVLAAGAWKLPYSLRDLRWLPPLLCFLALGMAVAYVHQPLGEKDIPDGYIARGVVRESAYTSSGSRLTVDLLALSPRRSGEGRALRAGICLYTDSVALRPGDCIAFPALLDLPETSEDYGRFLFGRGIDFTASLPADLIACTGRDSGITAWAATMRERTAALLQASRLHSSTASFLQALLAGHRAGLEPDTRSAFASAGIAHVLAVSGLHVGILVVLLLVVLKPLDLTGSRMPRYLLVMLLVWAFAVLTGLGAPVVRAAVMTACLLAGVMLQRPRSAVNSLCIAAFVILLFSPRALYDAGFLLSFGVTAGIILLASPLTPFPGRERRRLHAMLLWVTVPCVAFLCSWVTSAIFFHSVSLLFLPLNLLLAPLLPCYVYTALLYLLLLACGCDSSWIAAVLDAGYSALEDSAVAISSLPGVSAGIWLPEAAGWFYLCGMICFACMLSLKGRRWIVAGVSFMALAAATVILLPSPVPPATLSLRGDMSACAVVSYNRGERKVLLMPRDTLALGLLHGKTIIFLDTNIDARVGRDAPLSCHWLIVGSGYKGGVADLNLCFRADSILPHPSLSLDRRDELNEALFGPQHASCRQPIELPRKSGLPQATTELIQQND